MYQPNHDDSFTDILDEELGAADLQQVGNVVSNASSAIGGGMSQMGGTVGMVGQAIGAVGSMAGNIIEAVGASKAASANARAQAALAEEQAYRAKMQASQAQSTGAQAQAKGADMNQMMAAMTPLVASAVNKGGDALVSDIVVSLPNQIKDAVKEAMSSIRAGEVSAKQARENIANTVDQSLHPKLALALTALEQQRLQTQATSEHNAIVRRRDFERGVNERLNSIERAVARRRNGRNDAYMSARVRSILEP